MAGRVRDLSGEFWRGLQQGPRETPEVAPSRARKFNQEAIDTAQGYMRDRGIRDTGDPGYLENDVPTQTRIAELYDRAPSTPDDPEVVRAYDAFARETLQQYDAIRKQGVEFIPYYDAQPTPDGVDFHGYSDPESVRALGLKSRPGSAALREDVAKNHRMYVYADALDHPMLGNVVPGSEEPTTNLNWIFRGVHDYFGHVQRGNEFGPRGEENAWVEHSRMFSPEARRAMSTETRGQNSWVNFGPFGEANRANPQNTRYADQKAFLLPDEFTTRPEIAQPGLAERAGAFLGAAGRSLGERTGIVAEDVASRLNTTPDIPADPALRSAVEQAGGRVEPDRLVIPVTRSQEAVQGAVNQPALAGATFYTAGTPEQSRYVTPGQETLSGEGVFHRPLVVTGAVSELTRDLGLDQGAIDQAAIAAARGDAAPLTALFGQHGIPAADAERIGRMAPNEDLAVATAHERLAVEAARQQGHDSIIALRPNGSIEEIADLREARYPGQSYDPTVLHESVRVRPTTDQFGVPSERAPFANPRGQEGYVLDHPDATPEEMRTMRGFPGSGKGVLRGEPRTVSERAAPQEVVANSPAAQQGLNTFDENGVRHARTLFDYFKGLATDYAKYKDWYREWGSAVRDLLTDPETGQLNAPAYNEFTAIWGATAPQASPLMNFIKTEAAMVNGRVLTEKLGRLPTVGELDAAMKFGAADAVDQLRAVLGYVPVGTEKGKSKLNIAMSQALASGQIKVDPDLVSIGMKTDGTTVQPLPGQVVNWTVDDAKKTAAIWATGRAESKTGFKTPVFGLDTRERGLHPDWEFPFAVIDTHMFRAAGFKALAGGTTVHSNLPAARGVNALVNAVAGDMGWTPDEVQSAVWFGSIMENASPAQAAKSSVPVPFGERTELGNRIVEPGAFLPGQIETSLHLARDIIRKFETLGPEVEQKFRSLAAPQEAQLVHEGRDFKGITGEKVGALNISREHLSQAREASRETIPAAAELVARLHGENGGSTVSLRTGDRSGTPGFAVTLTPTVDHIAGQEITPDQVRRFISDHYRDLQAPRATVGTWFDQDKGRSEINVTLVEPDLETALRVARERGEKAIFDLQKFEEIPTGLDTGHLAEVNRVAPETRPLSRADDLAAAAGAVVGGVQGYNAPVDENDPNAGRTRLGHTLTGAVLGGGAGFAARRAAGRLPQAIAEGARAAGITSAPPSAMDQMRNAIDRIRGLRPDWSDSAIRQVAFSTGNKPTPEYLRAAEQEVVKGGSAPEVMERLYARGFRPDSTADDTVFRRMQGGNPAEAAAAKPPEHFSFTDEDIADIEQQIRSWGGADKLPDGMKYLLDDLHEAKQERINRHEQALGIVPRDTALRQPGGVQAPDSPALQRTPGVRVTPDGVEVDVSRFQKPEQAGQPVNRGGVFYQPGALKANQYGGMPGVWDFGGDQGISGPTLFRRPLVLDEASGATGPHAVARLAGDAAATQLSQGAEAAISGDQVNARRLMGVLNEFGVPDAAGQASRIADTSLSGFAARTAAEEVVGGHLARQAGYDGIFSTSGGLVDEIMDLREAAYPTPQGGYTLRPEFQSGIVAPGFAPKPGQPVRLSAAGEKRARGLAAQYQGIGATPDEALKFARGDLNLADKAGALPVEDNSSRDLFNRILEGTAKEGTAKELLGRGKEGVQRLRYSGLLSNTASAMTDVVTNALSIPRLYLRTGLAAAFEEAGAKAGKIAPEERATTFSEIKGFHSGVASGLFQAIEDSLGVMLHGGAPVQEEQAPGIIGRTVAGSEKLGTAAGLALEAGQRVRVAADVFAQHLGETIGAHMLAYREATREGIAFGSPQYKQRVAALIGEITGELRKTGDEAVKQGGTAFAKPTGQSHEEYVRSLAAEARAISKRQTFQQEMGATAKGIAQARGGLVGYLVPFYKTISNIATEGATSTPGVGGAVIGKDLVDSALHHGPYAGKEGTRFTRTDTSAVLPASQRLADQAVGLGVAALAGTLVAQGLLTGAGPADAKERASLRADGWQPFSFVFTNRAGKKEYVPVTRALGPLAWPVVFGAASMEYARDRGTFLDERAIGDFASAMQSYWFQESGLKGFKDVLDALAGGNLDAERQAIKRLAASQVTGLIPDSGLLRQVVAARDPIYRDPKSITELVKSGVPGLSETVPPKTNDLGEVQERAPGQTGARAFFPFQSTEEKGGVRRFLTSGSAQDDLLTARAADKVAKYRTDPVRNPAPSPDERLRARLARRNPLYEQLRKVNR